VPVEKHDRVGPDDDSFFVPACDLLSLEPGEGFDDLRRFLSGVERLLDGGRVD